MICYAFPLPIEQPGCRIFIFSPKAEIVRASFPRSDYSLRGNYACVRLFLAICADCQLFSSAFVRSFFLQKAWIVRIFAINQITLRTVSELYYV